MQMNIKLTIYFTSTHMFDTACVCVYVLHYFNYVKYISSKFNKEMSNISLLNFNIKVWCTTEEHKTKTEPDVTITYAVGSTKEGLKFHSEFNFWS